MLVIYRIGGPVTKEQITTIIDRVSELNYADPLPPLEVR